MKNTFRIFRTLLYLAALFCLWPLACADQADSSSLADLAVNCLQVGEYEQVFERCYIPPEYSPEAIAQAKEAFISQLRDFIEPKFGRTTILAKINYEPENLFVFKIGPLSTKEFVPFLTAKEFYEAEFSNIGQGYVIINMTDKDADLKIGYVGIALPAENPATQKLIWDFFDFTNQLYEALRPGVVE
jgi:hypothetical protein